MARFHCQPAGHRKPTIPIPRFHSTVNLVRPVRAKTLARRDKPIFFFPRLILPPSVEIGRISNSLWARGQGKLRIFFENDGIWRINEINIFLFFLWRRDRLRVDAKCVLVFVGTGDFSKLNHNDENIYFRIQRRHVATVNYQPYLDITRPRGAYFPPEVRKLEIPSRLEASERARLDRKVYRKREKEKRGRGRNFGRKLRLPC